MKNINDFINKANQVRRNARQSADSSMILNNPSNNNMIDDINGDYEMFENNMKEDTKDGNKPLHGKKKVKSKRKG